MRVHFRTRSTRSILECDINVNHIIINYVGLAAFWNWFILFNTILITRIFNQRNYSVRASTLVAHAFVALHRQKSTFLTVRQTVNPRLVAINSTKKVLAINSRQHLRCDRTTGENVNWMVSRIWSIQFIHTHTLFIMKRYVIASFFSKKKRKFPHIFLTLCVYNAVLELLVFSSFTEIGPIQGKYTVTSQSDGTRSPLSKLGELTLKHMCQRNWE